MTTTLKELDEVIANGDPHTSDYFLRDHHTEIRAALELKAKLKAVAWHTEDHLSDRSATTYDKAVADRWVAKGWPVTPMYYAAPPAGGQDDAR